jgi:hypothetical protein
MRKPRGASNVAVRGEPGGVRLQGRNHSNSSMRFRAAATTIHRPAQGSGSGGAMSSLCLVLYVIIFIELCFNFMSPFVYLSLIWSVDFSLSLALPLGGHRLGSPTPPPRGAAVNIFLR